MGKLAKVAYYGFTKEQYDSCKELRDSSNLKNVQMIALVAGSLEFLWGVVAINLSVVSNYVFMYIFYGLATLLVFILTKVKQSVLKPEVKVYAFMILSYSFAILISIPSREEKAILFLVGIVLLPILFIDYAWRIFVFMILVSVAYCTMAWNVKLTVIAQLDTYNVAAFCALGMITQYFVNKKVIGGFISRVQNERLLKAYEAVQEELKVQACTDLMTGLYNRTYFADHIINFMDNAAKEHDTIYFVMMDLDKFKRINDVLGHQEGDRVIIKVAEVIHSHLKGEEYAARLGGDEYIFVLAARFHTEALESVVADILREIQSIQLAKDWYASSSIGVTSITLQEHSFDELYKKTDQVLYRAKKNGGNQIVYMAQE